MTEGNGRKDKGKGEGLTFLQRRHDKIDSGRMRLTLERRT